MTVDEELDKERARIKKYWKMYAAKNRELLRERNRESARKFYNKNKEGYKKERKIKKKLNIWLLRHLKYLF